MEIIATNVSKKVQDGIEKSKDKIGDDENDPMKEWIAFKENIFPAKIHQDQPKTLFISESTTSKSFSNSTRRRTKQISQNARHQVKQAKKLNKFLIGFNALENILAITFLEETRRCSHERTNSLATYLRIEDLIELNHDISLICSQDLTEEFATIRQFIDILLEENSKFYYIKYLFGFTTKIDYKQFEMAVTGYFEQVLEKCDSNTLKLLLFEKDKLIDFEENHDQLQLQAYESAVEKYRKELTTILELRRKAENLLTVAELYKLEDDCIERLIDAYGEMYCFKLGPFVRMRETSAENIEYLNTILDSEDYGPKIHQQAKDDRQQLEDCFLSAHTAIQHIYSNYYLNVARLFCGQVTRAAKDQERYGRNAIQHTGAKDRLNRLRRLCSMAKITYFNCRKYSLQQQQTEISNENTNSNNRQELLSVRMKILLEQHSLLKLDLADLLAKSDPDGQQINHIDFYDTCETVEQFHLIDQQISMMNEQLKMEINFVKQKMIQNAQQRAKIRLEQRKCSSNASQHEPWDGSQTNETISLISSISSYNELSGKPRLSSSQTLNEKQKLRNFRKETVARLKRYKMRQTFLEKLDQQQQKTESIDSENSDDDDNYQDCIDEDDNYLGQDDHHIQDAGKSKFSIQSNSFPPSPPPPPPPPPPSLFPNRQPLVIVKTLNNSNRSNTKKTSPNKSDCVSTLINLDEILKMKGRLRCTREHKTVHISNNNKSDLEQILKSKLEQIRSVVSDDETIDQGNVEDNDDEFKVEDD